MPEERDFVDAGFESDPACGSAVVPCLAIDPDCGTQKLFPNIHGAPVYRWPGEGASAYLQVLHYRLSSWRVAFSHRPKARSSLAFASSSSRPMAPAWIPPSPVR